MDCLGVKVFQGMVKIYRFCTAKYLLKIFINEVFSGATDWLSALRSCIAEGGTLAKVESAAENSVVQVRVGRTGGGLC